MQSRSADGLGRLDYFIIENCGVTRATWLDISSLQFVEQNAKCSGADPNAAACKAAVPGGPGRLDYFIIEDCGVTRATWLDISSKALALTLRRKGAWPP